MSGELREDDAAALFRYLAQMDTRTLQSIERVFAGVMSPERLAEARRTPTVFLDTDAYHAHLRDAYPDHDAVELQNVVGDYLGVPYADRQQTLLPRTTAHERLHQLQDPAFARTVGNVLAEGTTEHFAGRIHGDLGIRDLPRAYPEHVRIVEMLLARVSERHLERAFFLGDVRPMRAELDAQLGPGAFSAVAELTALEKFDAAAAILKGQEAGTMSERELQEIEAETKEQRERTEVMERQIEDHKERVEKLEQTLRDIRTAAQRLGSEGMKQAEVSATRAKMETEQSLRELRQQRDAELQRNREMTGTIHQAFEERRDVLNKLGFQLATSGSAPGEIGAYLQSASDAVHMDMGRLALDEAQLEEVRKKLESLDAA